MIDLIQSLTSEMGTDAETARLIAGRTLGWLRDALARRFGDAAATSFESRVADFRRWRLADTSGSPGLSGEGPGESDPSVLGMDATLARIVGHLRIEPVKAGLAIPALGAYLKRCLPPDLLRQVLQVAPFLSMAAPERHPAALPVAAGPF